MRILVDTNTLFSAVITEGNEKQLLEKTVHGLHRIVVTDLIVEELERLFPRKLSGERAKRAEKVFATLLESKFTYMKERSQYIHLLQKAASLINQKDAPILAASLQDEIDALVTGDRDFLENPKLRRLRRKKIFTTKELLSRL
mgnify:FL=1